MPHSIDHACRVSCVASPSPLHSKRVTVAPRAVARASTCGSPRPRRRGSPAARRGAWGGREANRRRPRSTPPCARSRTARRRASRRRSSRASRLVGRASPGRGGSREGDRWVEVGGNCIEHAELLSHLDRAPSTITARARSAAACLEALSAPVAATVDPFAAFGNNVWSGAGFVGLAAARGAVRPPAARARADALVDGGWALWEVSAFVPRRRRLCGETIPATRRLTRRAPPLGRTPRLGRSARRRRTLGAAL